MNQPSHFDCAQAFARLEDYLDRELAPDEIRHVEEHMALCEVCAREFQFEAGVLCALKEKLRRISAPPDLVARIRQTIQQSKRQM